MEYAEVKKKEERRKKFLDSLSATTTQDLHTEEQHYECSNALGQDWSENGRNKYVKGQQGGQLTSSTPNVVNAEVDKSKKKGELR